LLQLDRPVPQLSDAELAATVERTYPWNFAVNLLDGATFWFGLSFMSSTTIVPLYISKLTDSQLAIGLVAVIAQASWFLPQLFTARPVERLARKKPVIVNLGFFTERLPMWLLPLSAALAVASPSLALAIFFLGYAGHGFGAGVVATAWQDMIARCFPANRRGRFFGTTTFVGNGTGAIGAIASAWILATFVFAQNFLLTFTIAAAFITISWFFLALTREPVQPVPAETASQSNFWAGLGDILRRDHNFRRFLFARLLLVMGAMSAGFVTVSAVQTWQVPDSTVGVYTTALLLGQTVGVLVFGLLADRYGHKLSLESGALAACLAYVLAWLAPAPSWYFATFVLMGIGSGAVTVSGILVVLEFSDPHRRPTYAGLANTAAGVLGSIAPILGAFLASRSYDLLFAASSVFYLAGFLALRLWVKEPRWSQP